MTLFAQEALFSIHIEQLMRVQRNSHNRLVDREGNLRTFDFIHSGSYSFSLPCGSTATQVSADISARVLGIADRLPVDAYNVNSLEFIGTTVVPGTALPRANWKVLLALYRLKEQESLYIPRESQVHD